VTSQGFSAGEPKLLFKQPPGTIAAATNGDRFLLAVPAKESTQVSFTMILNWPALLKKQEIQLH
jgi:hypothetical protein